MTARQNLIRGTVILTGAGLISRFMGFFFRIFLSHAFGEESVGLYQLIFPVYSLCISICIAGIGTALSRTAAEKTSSGEKGGASSALYTALTLTITLSFAAVLIVQQNAEQIARTFLGDIRCAPLLMIISYALPCAAVHSCVCGYSYGLQQTKIPALSQLVEQTVRIFTVVLLFFVLGSLDRTPNIRLAAAGIVAGEFFSAFYSVRVLFRADKTLRHPDRRSFLRSAGGLITLSAPLTANRTAVTLLQSIEAASIPACLKLSGLNTADALSTYGVLTGMALPCILFPSAITSSVSAMLMPAVTAVHASGQKKELNRLICQAAGSCFLLGLSCCLFFLLFGNVLGSLLFHSAMAGKFILTLAWICPFLYTNSALMSTINGLGRTGTTFLISASGLLVRIASVFLAIPRVGIQGYLWGLLASQFLMSALALTVLHAAGGHEKTAGKPGP